MKKIIAIGASNSSQSINKLFATHVAHQIEGAEVEVLDLNDFELPLFGPDLQNKIGIPGPAQKFYDAISKSNGIVLSLAEYNGMITTSFKNIWDWVSRIDMKIWQSKPIFLMATSPGGRGGANALRITSQLLPFFGGKVTAEFSLPYFHQNFTTNGIVNEKLKADLQKQANLFTQSLESKIYENQ